MKKKKDDEVGQPPKLTKDKLVYKWLESFQQHLSNKIGVRNTPFTYRTRPEVATQAVLLPCDSNQPFSENYMLIEHELKFYVSHVHNVFQLDNTALFHLVDCAVIGPDVSATIAPFRRTQNERDAYLAIVDQHSGRHVWDKSIKDATAVLQTRI